MDPHSRYRRLMVEGGDYPGQEHRPRLASGTSRCGESQPNVFLTIFDDGMGLPSQLGPGRGITNMRERASAVGGSLEVGPGEHGLGTRVTLRLPLAPEPSRESEMSEQATD